MLTSVDHIGLLIGYYADLTIYADLGRSREERDKEVVFGEDFVRGETR